jgi:RecA-family ATPase
VRDLDEAVAQISSNGDTAPLAFTLLRDLKPNLLSNDIIQGLIPRNAFVEAHAASGGGKTAIVVDLCLHIADGRRYRTRRVERQPVVYVALEGHGGIDNRCIAARDELEIADAPFALVKATDNFRDPEAAQKVAAIARQMLKDFGGDCPIAVIDTYTAALGPGGSDCDPKDVSAFIEHIKRNLLSIGC